MVKCEEKWPLSWIWQREILQFQFNTQFARAISLRDQPSILKCFCRSSFLWPTPILWSKVDNCIFKKSTCKIKCQSAKKEFVFFFSVVCWNAWEGNNDVKVQKQCRGLQTDVSTLNGIFNKKPELPSAVRSFATHFCTSTSTSTGSSTADVVQFS